jgi:catechol 2,3-dioxygenase-like lactoylglutathione lyase family enzyme
MSIGSFNLNHVNVTVAPALEDAAKHFYGTVIGMKEIPKPESTQGRGGAWYELGTIQLHLSREQIDETRSKRHICFAVEDLEHARASFADAGVEILPDDRPIAGIDRFYVRDPGGNLFEIAQG